MAQLNNLGSWWWEAMSSNKHELTLAISTLILTGLWYIWKFSMSSNGGPPLPPGPRSLPIVGYLPFLGRDLHKQFANMSHSYGPIFKFHIGGRLHVVINTPDLAKVVVREKDEIFANRNPSIAALAISYGGQDIVWSDNNSDWRNLRKIFVHEVLSNKNLEASSCFRRDEVRKTIKNVFSKIRTSINISEIAFSTEASVLTSMVWGNTSAQKIKGSNFGSELQMISSNIVELMGQANVSDIFPSLAWLDLQGVERKVKRELHQLDQIFTRIIDDRIESNSKKSKEAVGHEGKKDLLQILLELMDQKDAVSINLTQLKALIQNIMVAGTETTTTLIEWAMAEIMQNHNIMKRVQEELEEIVGLDNIVEESHLPKLQYLDATIKETFRLHPVVPLILPRSPSQDCMVSGYTIPKGCTVFLNVWAIHRDPRYWDNPLEFNPERFLANKCDFIGSNLNFFPFGSGRRSCPGVPLAEKMQMFILASLLHSFEWKLPEGEVHDLSEKFGITLKKREPLIAVPSPRLPNESLYM
ncbi:flavonoid 3',5'-hydroxylase 2 [Lactuca sativa]|uniref:flavonoid 3',5'-hydroxylase 2 n=1 Tax=Lactuca sativa TaxID=4236 RepID=UPI000CD9988B|nr:flavonoid 3',5'-hydroxylase 2 [Lactuca sativa]